MRRDRCIGDHGSDDRAIGRAHHGGVGDRCSLRIAVDDDRARIDVVRIAVGHGVDGERVAVGGDRKYVAIEAANTSVVVQRVAVGVI